MRNQEYVDYLENCGVCQICRLRYLNVRGCDYQDLKKTFEKLRVEYHPPENDADNTNLREKKKRANPCSTCLGLFSEEMQAEIIQGIIHSDIGKYDCNGIVIALSLPILLQIRQLSMWYALIKKFDDKISKDRAPDVPLKEAAKLVLNPIICKKLGKKYDSNGTVINVSLDHNNETSETMDLLKVSDLKLVPRNSRLKRQMITRSYIAKYFIPERLDTSIFEKFVSIPPSILSSGLVLQNITLCGPKIFVAGRYRKLSRKLSHTPWILQGRRIMEDSIEEIITRHIKHVFSDNSQKTIFSSSGREDVDVRCLGEGRPFVLEIGNALRVSLPKTIARDIELKIESSHKLSVKNLQIVHRDDLCYLKAGEEEKRKFYRALCTVKRPVTLEMIKKLQICSKFEILQKTPIRVLHRRPLHSRLRVIYNLKAFVDDLNTNVLIIDIVSQAGTYIKELVHGEFGRTTPSISSIIGEPVDIVALDVMGIDLDWPKNTDNK